jgi:hypothetical protein
MKCIHLSRALTQFYDLNKTWPSTTTFVKRDGPGHVWQEACPEKEENGTCIHSDHTQ